ncbi:MAG: LamG-like jellyroll fold domain-containing protein, partial [Cyanobacteria bacterium P01_H01_bin.15]
NVSIEFNNQTKRGCEAAIDFFSIKELEPFQAEESELKRPFAKSIFMNVLGWLPAEKFLTAYAEQLYDFPILPVQEGIVGQVNALGDHSVDVVLLDFLGAKRPSMVMPQFRLTDDWLQAIRKSRYPDIKFAPFWEYDSGGADPYNADAGVGSKNVQLAAKFVASILEYHNRRYRDTDELYRLQGKPVDFLYNSMIYNPPSFWADVISRLDSSLGDRPLLSLGPGGLPMTLHADFDSERFRSFTDEYFDSIFVFNLWGPTADSFPGKIAKYYRNQNEPIQVIGTAVPGYWSVRHNQRTLVSARYTQRLRESLSASLADNVDGIHVTTWNDFKENTQFFPSFTFLDSRLEILQALTIKWRGKEQTKTTDFPKVILTYKKAAYPGEPLGFEVYLLPTNPPNFKLQAKIYVETQDGELLLSTKNQAIQPGNAIQFPIKSQKVSTPDSSPGALSIKLQLEYDNKTVSISNLPQIAILPLDYLDPDLLMYSIPVHNLAKAPRSANLVLNNAVEGIVPNDGLTAYRVDVSGDEEIDYAVMRNSHAVRLMAPHDQAGAEFYPGRSSDISLAPMRYKNHLDTISDEGRSAFIPKIQNMRDGQSHYPIRTAGRNYYAGLVRYKDGSYAYTPLMWTTNHKDKVQLLGSYLFNTIKHDLIKDRGSYSRDINLGPESKSFRRTQIRPGFSILKWTNESPLVGLPNDFIPPGNSSVEYILRLGDISEARPVLVQSGQSRQLDLRINKERQFVLSRKNNLGVLVEVVSNRLTEGEIYHVVSVYTGTMLKLYVNGKLVDEKPCDGVRTGEGSWLGSHQNERFNGEIIRLNIYNGALSEFQILEMNARFNLLELSK